MIQTKTWWIIVENISNDSIKPCPRIVTEVGRDRVYYTNEEAANAQAEKMAEANPKNEYTVLITVGAFKVKEVNPVEHVQLRQKDTGFCWNCGDGVSDYGRPQICKKCSGSTDYYRTYGRR